MKMIETFNLLERLNAKEIIPIMIPYEDISVHPLIKTRGDSSESIRELVSKIRKIKKGK